ncbi:MAG: addiction module protein [Luteolibacter sp.]
MLKDLPQVQALSVSQKLELVDEIWMSMEDDAENLGISEEEKIILDQRWAEYLSDPSSALTLEQFKTRLGELRA